MRLLKFTPALLMLGFWFHVISSQQELKQAMDEPMRSDAFISGISKGFDDPWNHVTALDLYFQKLGSSHANNYIWASSDMLSREYWRIFQCQASLITRIKVSIAANQPQRLKHYEDIYTFIYNK